MVGLSIHASIYDPVVVIAYCSIIEQRSARSPCRRPCWNCFQDSLLKFPIYTQAQQVDLMCPREIWFGKGGEVTAMPGRTSGRIDIVKELQIWLVQVLSQLVQLSCMSKYDIKRNSDIPG